MKKQTKLFVTAILASFAMGASAQTPTGADYMVAFKKANANVVFDVNSEGQPFHIKWGMDTAWNWAWNVWRGIAHNAQGNFETGRISFQPNDLVTDNGDGTYTLSVRQKTALQSRIDNIKLTGTKEVNINCDHEMLFKNPSGEDDYTGRTNYQGKPQEWYKLIKASVQYTQAQGLKVVSVSPFNEPDYTNWQQYSGRESNGMKDFLEICKLLKADSFFDGIRICGGNTLNSDRALPWYNYLKDYIDEGNTHQLAGSFANYASFFAQVKADGKVGTGDELHNVGEAIVGANYGMETGIWWGYDSKARGQFMIDSNEGVRLGYAENRTAWTDAAVYRNDKTGEVHGYFGSSERQANNSSFAYVSTTKDVYFNGYGPTRMYVYDVPGGTGYQQGQINAERVFDITWGEDVAQNEIDGTYMLMNAFSKKMLTMNGTSDLKSATKTSSGNTQKWHVYPVQTAGDVSYWAIDNAGSANNHVNAVVDWGKLKEMYETGARVITYNNTGRPDEECWYLKYAKDGYYFVVNRLTNKCLYVSSSTTGAIVSLRPVPSLDDKNVNRYMWRFQPIDAKAETKAPLSPVVTSIKRRPGSIQLEWTAPADNDPLVYNIIRGEVSGDELDENGEAKINDWNTIGRNDTLTTFIDNTALAGKTYAYKVVAVDYAGNRSVASNIVQSSLLEDKALICQYQFDDDCSDNTANSLNASVNAALTYSSTATMVKSGEKSGTFGGSQYALLPYSVAGNDEMTIATWVRWGTESNWQRLFDFGNDETQYMFLTPSNGSEMRFVMKNKGSEEILSTGKKLGTGVWHHIAVTIKPIDGDKVNVVLYLDGEAAAESSTFTIKPTDINPSLCFIGRSMFNGDPLFNGRLDDFRIYNYALSADAVKAMMDDVEAVSKDVKDSYEEVSTDISSVSNVATGNGASYDFSGRQIAAPKNGMFIENGKKVKK